MRALISTSDKSGLDTFARGLAELGWELVASGGTAAHMEELGLEVTRVESLTDVPELLGGRVKTLHPRIHAGILARRDRDDDVATLEQHEIAPFDLVCVNLYPFEQATARRGVTEAEAVELIDVGGPSLLRGAAKNFAHVAAVCRPEQYEPGLVRRGRGVPDAPHARVHEGARPRVRREPAPAGRLLPGERRAPPPPLAGRAAARPRALVQQPQRPERGAPRSA